MEHVQWENEEAAYKRTCEEAIRVGSQPPDRKKYFKFREERERKREERKRHDELVDAQRRVADELRKLRYEL